MISRLLVALAIALLCAAPASAGEAWEIDPPDRPSLVDDAIATDILVPPAAPRLVEAQPAATGAPPAADPGRGRVFRPPRA